MIEFQCPKCEKLLKVSDEKAGVRTECPGCTNPLTIPKPDDQIVEEEVSFEQEADASLSATEPGPPSKTKTCPMCGEQIRDTAIRCRFCGEHLSWETPVGNEGLWRDGNLLVMRKTAQLPDRCVKSNQPADGYRLTRKLYWHHPAISITILGCLLPYIILALVLRQDAEIKIGLSDQWVGKRHFAIMIGWTTALLSSVMLLGSIIAQQALGEAALFIFYLSIVVFLIGTIYGVASSRMIVPARITDDMVWLKGVHADFLAELPDLVSDDGSDHSSY